MKYPIVVAAVLSAATAAGLAFAAQSPEIPPERIDSMVAQVLRQADQTPNQTPKPDGKTIRQDVVKRLQTLEVLKNEAFKAGLNKDPDVQNLFKTVEAEFYADQYAQYLERSTEISEAEVRRFYDLQTRMIKIQQAAFPTSQAALDAQSLLLKGLSFEDLMKRYPNPEQSFDGFIMPQQLPPQLASRFENMNRGDVTREPVQIGDRFFLFKLSAVERNPDAPPFELARKEFEQQLKGQKVRQHIDRVLENNGIKL